MNVCQQAMINGLVNYGRPTIDSIQTIFEILSYGGIKGVTHYNRPNLRLWHKVMKLDVNIELPYTIGKSNW